MIGGYMNQVLIGAITVVLASSYFYYKNTEAELAELRQLNQAYELKFVQQEETIAALQQDFELQTTSLLEIQLKNQEIQTEMNRYLDIFKRHNLTKLAAAKPSLIETRANKGTKEVFDGIEADSVSIGSLNDGVQFVPTDTSGSEDSN